MVIIKIFYKKTNKINIILNSFKRLLIFKICIFYAKFLYISALIKDYIYIILALKTHTQGPFV